MKNLLKKIILLGAAVGAMFGVNAALASTIGQQPAVFETYLASQQLSTDTSLTLASATLRDGSTLSGYVCLTIDSNTPSLEYECGTLSGTTVTGLTRGIDAITGTTSIASLQVTHRRGADVKVTDYPIVTQLARMFGGQDTIPVALHYASGTTVNGSDLQALVNVQLLNSTAVSGAPNASSIVKGIVQLATAAQAALGTALGSTGAALDLPASISTSTPYNSGSNVVPVTGTNEKLSQLFLDLTQQFTFTSAYITSASSTNATTTNETVTGNLIGNTASFSGLVTGISGVSATNFEAAASISTGQALYSGFGTSDGGLKSDTDFSSGGNSNSVTVGNNANRILVLFAYVGTAGASVTAATYNGTNFTAVDSDTGNQCNGTNLGDCYSFIMVNPSTGANTLAVTPSSGTAKWIVYSFYNAKQTGQPEAHSITTSCSSHSLSTVANGSIMFGAASDSGTLGGTVAWENAQTSSSFQAADSGLVYPAAQAVTATNSQTAGDCLMVSVAPATAPVMGELPASSAASSGTTRSQFINSFLTFNGFALNTASFGNTVTVQTDGILSTTTVLNSTSTPYYLNDTPGSIGASVGTSLRKVGMEASTSAIDITNIW